jgi:hypothetical protein
MEFVKLSLTKEELALIMDAVQDARADWLKGETSARARDKEPLDVKQKAMNTMDLELAVERFNAYAELDAKLNRILWEVS